jgi:hypothetical protein
MDENTPQIQPDTTPPAIAELGPISNVDASVYQYIRNNYLKAAAVLSLFVLCELFALYLSRTHTSFASLFFYIPVFALLAIYYNIRQRVMDAFRKQFAAINGFTFQGKGWPINADGGIFSIGHSRTGTDLIIGSFQNMPIAFFDYSYTVGEGKSSHSYFYTVFQLDYPSPLPPIFLQPKTGKLRFAGISNVSALATEHLHMEGDFDTSFNLYSQKGFEIETLQVFSPDFMATMQDHWKGFCLEFINSHLYIYSPVVTTSTDLDKMYQLAQYLIQKIGPLAERMKSSITALEGYYNPAAPK